MQGNFPFQSKSKSKRIVQSGYLCNLKWIFDSLVVESRTKNPIIFLDFSLECTDPTESRMA